MTAGGAGHQLRLLRIGCVSDPEHWPAALRDDDAILVTSRDLSAEGDAEIRVATSGPEPYDVVLLDLPDDDDLLDLVADIARNAPRAAVVVVTSGPDTTVASAAARLGVDGCILRDVSQPASVPHEIRMAVARRSQLLALADEAARLMGEATSMRRFAQTVAHDLRGPMSTLRLQVMEMSAEGTATSRDIALVLASVERSCTYVHDLLAAVTPGAEVTRELVDISVELIQAAAAAGAESDMILEGDGDLGSIIGPPVLIRQAIVNIVTNAVRHANLPDRPLMIRVRREPHPADPSIVDICIEDNGPGILPALREASLRGVSATTQRTVNGLGLRITRSALTRQGGELRLESAPDGGLLVRLRFAGQ